MSTSKVQERLEAFAMVAMVWLRKKPHGPSIMPWGAVLAQQRMPLWLLEMA